MTAELDFRRDHFAAADTPLVFSPGTHKPAIFRGLVAFEYVRGIAEDVHGMGKLMMANGAPDRLCWLAPLLDVMGTETDWNPGGKWQPMSDAEMLYRRAMCKGKPYCFLMNTQFDKFSHELVEKYMKRSLAYGMFPGFFSHNASRGTTSPGPSFTTATGRCSRSTCRCASGWPRPAGSRSRWPAPATSVCTSSASAAGAKRRVPQHSRGRPCHKVAPGISPSSTTVPIAAPPRSRW